MPAFTGDSAATITKLIGDVAPATDSLVKSLAESVQKRREHDHPKHEDFFCFNQVSWAGERIAFLIRRLLDAEAETVRLRAELLEYTHPVATCRGCHHIAPWHVSSLGKTDRPCTQGGCGCADLTEI